MTISRFTCIKACKDSNSTLCGIKSNIILLVVHVHIYACIPVYSCRNEGGRPNRRLFCYIDSDHFQVPVEEVGGCSRQCSMDLSVLKVIG